MPNLHVASFADLDTATLYALLRLRVDVFVVEQECPYPELDGRDTEPSTVHVWYETAGEPVAYLRILEEDDDRARIGRVVVSRTRRGSGLAQRLMLATLDHLDGRACVLDAQTYLVGFYRRLGFMPTGPEFLDDDGVPHVPMARPAARA